MSEKKAVDQPSMISSKTVVGIKTPVNQGTKGNFVQLQGLNQMQQQQQFIRRTNNGKEFNTASKPQGMLPKINTQPMQSRNNTQMGYMSSDKLKKFEGNMHYQPNERPIEDSDRSSSSLSDGNFVDMNKSLNDRMEEGDMTFHQKPGVLTGKRQSRVLKRDQINFNVRNM